MKVIAQCGYSTGTGDGMFFAYSAVRPLRTVYWEIFCVVLFLQILLILKFCKNLLAQKNNYAHVSCICTHGNQLNGHGQEAG